MRSPFGRCTWSSISPGTNAKDKLLRGGAGDSCPRGDDDVSCTVASSGTGVRQQHRQANGGDAFGGGAFGGGAFDAKLPQYGGGGRDGGGPFGLSRADAGTCSDEDIFAPSQYIERDEPTALTSINSYI